MLLLSLLFFTAALTFIAGVWLLLAPTRAQQRLRAMARSPGRPGWSEKVLKIAQPLARLSTPKEDWADSALRVRFFNAGIRQENARYYYFGAKTAFPILFGLLAYLFLGPGISDPLSLMLVVLVGATFGCYLPNLAIALAIRARKREILDNFPDAADLLLVCVEAGLGLDAALAKVADEIGLQSVALSQELHLTLLEMRAGGTREQALRNLAMRTAVEELGVFAVMLTQAEKFGTSIGDSLRVFSDDLRHRRQTRAEERAAKVPTKMLFPLVFFIFPSIIMVILGPALIQIVRTVMPAISGQG